MKIKDYIFYRMYTSYTKAKDDGIFASISFFVIIEFFLLTPFFFIIIGFTSLEGKWRLVFLSILMLIIFILNCKRYYKKGRVVEIIRRYRNSKYNTIIKNWMVYSLIFFAIAWGMMGIAIIMESYWYIKGLWS